jgi:hypothetical protein
MQVAENFGARVGQKVERLVSSSWSCTIGPKLFFFWGGAMRVQHSNPSLSRRTWHDTTRRDTGTTPERHDKIRHGQVLGVLLVKLTIFLIWPTKGKAKQAFAMIMIHPSIRYNQPTNHPNCRPQLWAGLVRLGAWLGLAWPGRSIITGSSVIPLSLCLKICISLCISLGAMWREMRCRVISFPASGLSV